MPYGQTSDNEEDPFNGQEFDDSEDEEPVDLMSQISRQPGMLVGADAATAAWDPDFGSVTSPSEQQSPTSHQAGWSDAFSDADAESGVRMFDRSRSSPETVPRLQMDRLLGATQPAAPPPAKREEVLPPNAVFNSPGDTSSPYAPFGSPPEGTPNPFASSGSDPLFPPSAVDTQTSGTPDDYRPFG